MVKKPYNLILVDANNLVMRAFWANSKLSLRVDGEVQKTGLIYGSFNMLLHLQEEFPGIPISMVWDAGNHRRKKLYPQYKANRKPMKEFESICLQRDQFRKILRYTRITQTWKEKEEADDVIASLARKTLGRKLIVSSDHDLFQLVRDKVHLLDKNFTIYGPNEVLNKWRVKPEQLIFVYALAGCKSDNIPGVRGIGDKIAIQIVRSNPRLVKEIKDERASIKKIKDVSKFYKKRLMESRDVIDLSFRLSMIEDGLEDLEIRKPKYLYDKFYAELMRFKCHSLLAREDELEALCSSE